jgi:hypothetical protein
MQTRHRSHKLREIHHSEGSPTVHEKALNGSASQMLARSLATSVIDRKFSERILKLMHD